MIGASVATRTTRRVVTAKRPTTLQERMLGLGAAVAALAVLVGVVGMLLPREHRATRTAFFDHPPAALWDALTDRAFDGRWRPELESVEHVLSDDGHASWREVYKNGRVVTLDTSEAIAPRRLVQRQADEGRTVSATWSFDIAPSGTGSRLSVVEERSVSNPYRRIAQRGLHRSTASIDHYLRSVAAKLGEPLRLEP